MLELSSVVLFKVILVSKADQYSLVIAQKFHLSEGQKERIICRIKESQIQIGHLRFEYPSKCCIKNLELIFKHWIHW